MATKIPATLIPGDGIGPEVTQATLDVLEAVDAPFEWEWQKAGMAGVDACGDPLPRETLESIRGTRLALKGPLTTPVGGGFRSSNVRLREEFELYANLRPARTLVPGRFEKIDLVLVRENLEGLYVGFEHYVPIGDDPRAVAVGTGINTRAGSTRICEFAFDYAVKHNRKKVTLVHKANVLKALTGLFLDAGREVAKKYEGRVAVDERIIDACAMQLVMNPWQFDVIVTTNLFGDILTDLGGAVGGGIGRAASGNLNPARTGPSLFEPVHGSAPDIAGTGKADPRAAIISAAMMLDHVGEQEKARKIRAALDGVLCEDQVRTGDLGGKASTKEFTQAIIRRLR